MRLIKKENLKMERYIEDLNSIFNELKEFNCPMTTGRRLKQIVGGPNALEAEFLYLPLALTEFTTSFEFHHGNDVDFEWTILRNRFVNLSYGDETITVKVDIFRGEWSTKVSFTKLDFTASSILEDEIFLLEDNFSITPIASRSSNKPQTLEKIKNELVAIASKSYDSIPCVLFNKARDILRETGDSTFYDFVTSHMVDIRYQIDSEEVFVPDILGFNLPDSLAYLFVNLGKWTVTVSSTPCVNGHILKRVEYYSNRNRELVNSREVLHIEDEFDITVLSVKEK